ncbi:hypothetical protein M0805_007958 [Coniferiporia weirii]|nr:hypothetical protein M0805_007958 [Coniferiporia weirii]
MVLQLYNVSNALAYSEPLLILLGNKLTLQIVHNHEYRLVHGDVKADNVLVGEDRAYLSDFGSSVALYDVSGASSSNAGGNWRYKAPELLEVTNTVHITPETDVYAFGCLALEVFTGSAPWDGLKESEGLSKKMRCQYPGRPRQSIGNDNLWFLMLECWKEAPTLRPTTRDLCIRLEDMLVASSSGHWQ